jgi:hypothetical protein
VDNKELSNDCSRFLVNKGRFHSPTRLQNGLKEGKSKLNSSLLSGANRRDYTRGHPWP